MTPRRLPFVLAVLLMLVGGLPACGDDPASAASDSTAPINAVVEDARLLTTLHTALRATGLDDELASGGPYTLFAPSDEAFFNLGVESADAYLDPAHRDLLTAVLRRHIVLGAFPLSALEDGQRLPTLDGAELAVRVTGSTVIVDDGVVHAEISGTSREAANGVVHEIDALLRGVLTTSERLRLIPLASTFYQALEEEGTLARIDGPHTLLVPLNDGFERLAGGAAPLFQSGNTDILRKVVDYHAVSLNESLSFDTLLAAGPVPADPDPPLAFAFVDDLAYVNGERLLVRDVRTADGIIHLLLRPLLEPLTLWEHLRITPQTSRFRSALTRVGIQFTLDNAAAGPFTLFVPDNAAFDALGQAVATPLLGGSWPEVLRQVAQFHVAEGRFPFDELNQGDRLPTLEGAPIRIRRDNETSLLLAERTFFDENLDIGAANGLIHYVDEVLNPPLNLVDQTFFSGYLSFLALIGQSGLEGELRAGGPYTFVAPASVPSGLSDARFACYQREAVLSQIAEGVHPFDDPLGISIPTLEGEGIGLAQSGGDMLAAFPGGRVLDREIEADNGLFYGVETSAFDLAERPDCP